MKIDRLLSIIVILLNRDRITAKELASRFEVSVRTIYRDIDAINMAGIPIIALQGNDGGFSIMDNYTIKRHLFTFEDMMSVISALKGMNTVIGDESISDAIEKFHNMLPESARVNPPDAQKDIVVDVVPWGSKKDIQPLFKTIYAAIRDQKIVRFAYTSYMKESSVRTVEPLSLVFKGYSWYLYAFCRERADLRLFKLTRINDFFCTNDSFGKRAGEYSSPKEDNSNPLMVTLRFPLHLRDRFDDYFKEESFVLGSDGFVTLEAPMQDAPWLYKMLLSFDDEVEVVLPEFVKKKLSEKAFRIYKKYSSMD